MDDPTAPALIIYVDVDDTFVRSVGSKRIPIPATIAQIRQLNESGAELYCWSSGGAAYAKDSATEFGIADCFVAFLPKPQVLIDDLRIDQWRYLLQLLPSNTLTIEEIQQRL
jgi:hypothetical protein